MAIPATTFRQNIFKLLERVAQTGEPLEVTLKGHRLKVVSAQEQSDKFCRLVKHGAIVGEAEELARLNMSDTWTGQDQL